MAMYASGQECLPVMTTFWSSAIYGEPLLNISNNVFKTLSLVIHFYWSLEMSSKKSPEVIAVYIWSLMMTQDSLCHLPPIKCAV